MILLVDDDREFRHWLRIQLEKAGYRVLEASAGDQALEILADARAEVMLVDLASPGLDGMALLRERRRRASPRLQTIGLTGVDPLEARLQSVFHSLGVTRFIPKPVEIGILLQAIEGGRLTAKAAVAR